MAKKQDLKQVFGLNKKEMLSIIGSGGKTSLLWLLAEECRQEKTLVSTTTKIFLPPSSHYDFFLNSRALELIKPTKNGIYLGAELPEDPDGSSLRHELDNPHKEAFTLKLSPLKLYEEFGWDILKKDFDKILLEADGARNRQLKAWREYEPTIASGTSLTIGLINISPLGQKISENNVHRVKEFLSLTDAKAGEEITLKHYVQAISSPQGLFAKAKGRLVLFINGAKDRKNLNICRELIDKLPKSFSSTLEKAIAGCTRQKEFMVILNNLKA